MDEPQTKKITLADMANQNIKTAQDTPQAQAKEPSQAPVVTTQIKNEPLFFNVMPRSKDQGQITQPTLKVEEPSEEKKDNLAFIKNNKLYFIIGGGIVILGLVIYFVANYIGSSSIKSDIKVNTDFKPAPTKPINATSSPQQTGGNISGITTPKEWRDRYFPNCSDTSLCGDQADPDHDGLTNINEYKLGTDPNHNDSDLDGIADGDEVNVFSTNPLNAHSASDPQFNDADYIKGGYDIGTGKKMTSAQIAVITSKMKSLGLHEPTLKTLGNVVNSVYGFSAPIDNSASSTPSGTPTSTPANASSTSISGFDLSPGAKQDRDTKRSNTIKNIEAALVKYQTDNKAYPTTSDFSTMFAQVRLYLKVATNPVDPINSGPYVYGYTSSDATGTDFTLSFFSEGQNQLIKKHSADAIKDSNADQAAIYDDQRQTDLENIRSALLLYSQNNVAGNQTYVFPSEDKYKTAIVPDFLEQIPKDPKTGQDYVYKVSDTFNTFTIKALLESPPSGTTGYLCNQEECMNY